jgi:nucleotide-binding universal stress UspA family protein
VAEKPEIKRILVALEPSASGRAALAAAAEMAASLHAELVGVYVEDIDLLHMAGLPFCREYSVEALEGRDMDTGAMARAFRGQASRLRRAMELAADRQQVRWSFRVARGPVAGELLAASEEADLVIVGRAARPSRRRARVGSTTRTIVTSGTRTVVVVHPGGAVARPVLVWFDGSRSAMRALITGARLAAEDHKNICVLLAATDEKKAKKLRAKAVELLADQGVRARYALPSSIDLPGLLQAMQAERCRTLVVPADSPVLSEEASTAVLERIDCPVVLVR